ncbi:hypothetical protein GDO86_003941 [Hymenochirus boettgeri]|nr:hypothetical protein GDO86_003941 [Hymenochirus boettgeri]
MKDYIKDCSKCQERMDRSRSSNDPNDMIEELGLDVRSDSNETDDESNNPASNANQAHKSSKKKPVAKHELVFVDSKGILKQSSSKHGQIILDQLNQQRLSNQFCDVTLLIEGEEYKAHKAVLAASSEYFRDLFIEKGAVSSHEAFVDLPGFCKSSFLPLLEFAYTSELRFDFCSMAEVSMLARHLLMNEVLEICESVHRQMETNQINLYQKVDMETLACGKKLVDNHVVQLQRIVDNAPPLLADAINCHKTIDVNECLECEVVDASETVANTIDDGIPQPSVKSPVQLVSHEVPISSLSGTTALYVSNVPSELQPTVIIPTVLDVSDVQADSPQTVCITQEVSVIAEHTNSVGCDIKASDAKLPIVSCNATEQKLPGPDTQTDVGLKEFSTSGAKADPPINMDIIEDQPVSAIAVENTCTEDMVIEITDPEIKISEAPKRKRGRPRKTLEVSCKKNTQETFPFVDKSYYKGKLRDRLLAEGDYIKMHKGQGKFKKRKTYLKSAVQQAAMRLLQRGRKKRKMVPRKQTKDIEALFKCNDCGMMFQRRYALIMHSVKHEKTKEFKCPLCTKEFQYRASLRAHLIRHSKTGKSDVSVVEADVETAKGMTKRQFICGICGRTLPKLYSLRIHMLKHTGVKPHACKVCGKTFTHKHGLKMHQALHESQKQFKCDMCDKSFVTNRSLQEHVSTHTGESKYLCSVCGKAFHRASGLSKHVKKHRPKTETRGYQCTQCEKSFVELRDLQQHMNKHLGVKPFECEFCGKSYSWKKDWYSHVKSHSVTEPYRCSICGKEFYEKALYRRHVNKATHGKKGRTKLNFEKACEHCGKIFTQFREYRRHVNNHEGVKPFECLTCGVAWADARSLKRHVRTHTGERPYVCPVCNEGYIDARTLRKHMTKYHKDYVPGKIMLEKDSLQFHNQGTQVEHAVSILSTDLDDSNAEIVTEEIETVVVSEDSVTNTPDCTAVSTLSDQSIMQVVNYVLAQHQGQKITEVADEIETVEVEVGHISEVV